MKLKEAILQYISLKKAAGDQGNTLERILNAFCRAVGDEILIAHVSPQRVHDLIVDNGPLAKYWLHQHWRLRGFYGYAVSRGFVSSSPLPRLAPKAPTRFVPYIYSHEELRRLLAATASYRKQQVLLEPHTLRVILLLLYGAGLRLSEALALTLSDVDLAEALIIIRETKFYKTRAVPLASRLNDEMRCYLERRQQAIHRTSDASFFVLRDGAKVPGYLVDQAFRRLRKYVGISRSDGGRYQPRLHDLRHYAEFRTMPSRAWQGARMSGESRYFLIPADSATRHSFRSSICS